MDDTLDISGVSEEGEEQITSEQVFQQLEEIWVNERLSPNLMLCRTDITECILEQMQEMEENIARAKKTDLKVSLHQLELDRIRYVLSSYLRCRLEKIEKHAAYLIKKESSDGPSVSRLSPEEFMFAKELTSGVTSHLTASALKHMPKNLQTLNLEDSVPNLDHYVFLRVNKAEEGIIVDCETDVQNEDKIDLEVDAQHIMRYKLIENLVENQTVSLI
ncbi:DNA replication complex GINS protein SLD5 [Ciona intestinalis]|uniref:DNA replication complex GINS protein SLD5 n=1 Tax=Ciona intestinalis TaxID=7719 RepID=UPI00006A5160|nr:DNA replication complex GINS protein SLD5 [Ciona intestinalis]|eukprot:XP_002129349.1 DNA replication complex GINS protein SLD5 [Ciona intestinalis]